MKLLNYLKIGRRQKPLPPIRTVQPPGQARAERRQTAERRLPPEIERRKEPTLGSIFEDTGSLELTKADPAVDENPYDTQSWHLHPSDGMHRVDDLKQINRERKDSDRDNPYDRRTGRKRF